MFVGITNTPRDYAWGSSGPLADLLGRDASGGPEAEYWLGTHHGSPSVTAAGDSLAEVTALPFIMKVLAAGSPVSLQAHPSPAQAVEGFARENAAGIPLDAPYRNYKDTLHKPELIYAVSETLEALCGFRPVAATRELLARLGDESGVKDALVDGFLARLADDASLPGVFEWLVSGGSDIDALLVRVVALCAERGVGVPEFDTVTDLARFYPGDPGILISLLLNRVSVGRGEVVYLPSGNIHSYQSGLGIEVMAASDNVLRGGLTPKHVDVPELLSVLDFRPLPVPFLDAVEPSAGVRAFRPDVPDFELVVIQPAAGESHYSPNGESIALCVDGDIVITGAQGEITLARGGSVYVTADEPPLSFQGSGTLFLSSARAEN